MNKVQLTLLVLFVFWLIISTILWRLIRQYRAAKPAEADVAQTEAIDKDPAHAATDDSINPVSAEAQPALNSKAQDNPGLQDSSVEPTDAEPIVDTASDTASEKDTNSMPTDTHAAKAAAEVALVDDKSDKVTEVGLLLNNNAEQIKANATANNSSSDANDHPEIEETAAEVVAKDTSESGPKKSKRRRSKRKQSKAAKSAAAAAAATNPTQLHHSDEDETSESAKTSQAYESEEDETVEAVTGSEPDQQPELAPVDASPLSTKPSGRIHTLLQDINFPYDLYPITDNGQDADQYVTYVSHHAEPSEVGTAFADELERIGFKIEPAGNDEAIAKLDGDTLTMRITPEAGTSSRHPNLDAADVAIEIWTL